MKHTHIYKYEIWKNGSLYIDCDDKKDAYRMYKVVDETWKPKHLQLYEIVLTKNLLKGRTITNEEID